MNGLIHALHEPKGEGPFPSVLALHGYGSNALDLLGLAPHLCGGRLLVIAPQAPDDVPLGPPGSGAPMGHGWFPLSPGNPPSALSVASAVTRARDFLDAAVDRYPIDRHRLAVLGFSQGGIIAHALALSDPARFRALAALSSWLPDELAASLPKADRSRLAAWVQHGTRDEIVSVSRGRAAVAKLRDLGAAAEYHEYEMGHEVNARSLLELSAWLDQRLA